MQMRARGDDRLAIVPIDRTRGGVDARTVFLEALPEGRLAESMWCENDHRLLISEAIPAGEVASVARHLFDAHTPELIDDSLELTVCDVAACPYAREWVEIPAPDLAAVF
jgi:hypothetical protein